LKTTCSSKKLIKKGHFLLLSDFMPSALIDIIQVIDRKIVSWVDQFTKKLQNNNQDWNNVDKGK